MIYVFTFLGEFGYELFNWQGVVRKFAGTIDEGDQIVCCSRPGLHVLYESADAYVDVSTVPSFTESVACGYFALKTDDGVIGAEANLEFDKRLRKDLRSSILEALWKGKGLRGSRMPLFLTTRGLGHRFIFSSERATLRGCAFGADRTKFGTDPGEGNIYEGLDLSNNVFRRIAPDLAFRPAIEDELGMDLEEPFILCQTRSREIVVRSPERVLKEGLIEKLAQRMKVVLLSFETGRRLDSYSAFQNLPNCLSYVARSFSHQSCLVHFAKHCLFFTEGDFGSHIYVPPFLGKNVTVVAPESVYRLGTTPIEFWNQNVFKFGGQLIPKTIEEVLASERATSALLDSLVHS